ncbi:MAG: hypothetical protein Q9216_004985 [Gyalolechia sp. 2 TL-2023]
MNSSLHDKVVLVTGSSNGLGRATALRFAQAGAHLVVCADLVPSRKLGSPPSSAHTTRRWSLTGSDNERSHAAPAQTIGEGGTQETHHSAESSEMSDKSLLPHDRCTNDGDEDERDAQKPTHETIRERYGDGKAMFVGCDVTVEEGEGGMKWAVEETIRMGGRLNICKYATAHFLARGGGEPDDTDNGEKGCIVNISSVAGNLGVFECSAYSASKAASLAFTRALTVEYASKGIRCNAIAAGYIHTSTLTPFLTDNDNHHSDNHHNDNHNNYHQPSFPTYLKTVIPTGRLGKPSDVAKTAVWLGDAGQSGYVHGVVVPVDGGFSAR